LGQVGLDPLQEVRRRGDEGRVGLGIEADVVGVVLRDQPAGLVAVAWLRRTSRVWVSWLKMGLLRSALPTR